MDFYEQSFAKNNLLFKLLDRKSSFVFSFTFISFSSIYVRKSTMYLIKNVIKKV